MPFQRRHAFAGLDVPDLERVVVRPETTRRPSGNTATLSTYDEDTSSQKYSGRRNARPFRVPFQRRHAFAGRHVPHLERLVARRRHDAPPVRKHGNAIDLRRSQIITKVQWTPQRTSFECPFSVATHLPVATSHTLSVLVPDPDTTRRPSGNTATLIDLRRSQIITKVQWTPQRTGSSALSASAARRASTGPRLRKNGMNRRSPRDAVATALASQIDCRPSSVRLPTGVVARRRVDRWRASRMTVSSFDSVELSS